MSLKDLLPEGTFDEITAQANEVSPQQEKNNNNMDTPPAQSGEDIIYVNCPTCKKKIVYSSSNPYRPFCSERCKLIDLGAWASDERKIAGKSLLEDDDAAEIQLYENNQHH